MFGAWVTTNLSQRIVGPLVQLPAPVTFNVSQLAPDLIATYERRRRAANERSMSPTRAASHVLGVPDWLVPTAAAKAGLHLLARHPAMFERVLQNISTLFVERPE